jgi:hypothetical protein
MILRNRDCMGTALIEEVLKFLQNFFRGLHKTTQKTASSKGICDGKCLQTMPCCGFVVDLYARNLYALVFFHQIFAR